MQKHIALYCLLMASITGLSQESAPFSEEKFESVINLPVNIVQVSKHHYFIDFGKTFFGTVILESAVGQNDSLVIHLGEKLESKNRIDRNPGGTIRYQRVSLGALPEKQMQVVALTPNPRNTTPPAIQMPDSFGVIMPFRYCEIENLTAPIEGMQIGQKSFHYQFNDEASDFSSSDSVLDAIWELCKHSIKATSFAGVYIDGDRERIPYEADAFINQLSHYSVDSVYSLARRSNEYFIKHPTWPTEWILHTVLLFYYDYLYTGDISAFERHYEALKLKTLMELEREDGLISSASPKVTDDFLRKLGFKASDKPMQDIVDWPPANIITRYMWGITPANPGFAKVRIAPKLGNLTRSKIKVPTIRGAIYGKYHLLENDTRRFNIELPAGMHGEFIITEPGGSIRLQDKVIQTGHSTLLLTPGSNRIEIGN